MYRFKICSDQSIIHCIPVYKRKQLMLRTFAQFLLKNDFYRGAGGGGGYEKYFWKFQGGEVLSKILSMVGVWIFSGGMDIFSSGWRIPVQYGRMSNSL